MTTRHSNSRDWRGETLPGKHDHGVHGASKEGPVGTSTPRRAEASAPSPRHGGYKSESSGVINMGRLRMVALLGYV
jgi:hypothetical protein